MSVTVQPISIAGGRTQSSSFSDTMNRTSGPMGASYNEGFQFAAGAPVAFASAAIAASSVDGNQCMKISTNQTGVGVVQPMLLVPVQPVGLNNASQFVQWTVVRHLRTAGVNSLFCGPAVMIVASGLVTSTNYYILQFQTPGAICAAIRVVGGVQTGLGAAIAFADGDVFKLSATINASDVTIKVFKNGVLQETDVDNAAGRLTQGMPGFATTSMNEASGNYVSEWRNFSSGPA
jgi:hypothetical protein